MDTNWDLLIENHFKGKKEEKTTLSLDVLLESINEVMSEMPDLRTPLNERIGSPATVSYDGIPEISLTELGWNKL